MTDSQLGASLLYALFIALVVLSGLDLSIKK